MRKIEIISLVILIFHVVIMAFQSTGKVAFYTLV
jgi:hypothetical protein